MKILWAVKIGNPDWATELITEDEAKIPEAKKWAEENGFDRFRIADIDLSIPPDFAGTINLKRIGELSPEEIKKVSDILESGAK